MCRTVPSSSAVWLPLSTPTTKPAPAVHARLQVPRGVSGRQYAPDVPDTGQLHRFEDHVRRGAARGHVVHAHHRVQHALAPAQDVEQAVHDRPVEAGGQRYLHTLGSQLRQRFRDARDRRRRRFRVVLREPLVEVGELDVHFGASEHRRDRLVLVGAHPPADVVRAATGRDHGVRQGFVDESVLLHGGAGHVQHDQVDGVHEALQSRSSAGCACWEFSIEKLTMSGR